MRYLTRPVFTVRQILDLCISSIRDLDLTKRLKLATKAIESAEAEYVVRAENASLYKMPGASNVAGHVSKDEMGRIYTQTFVKSKKTRHIYDAIKKIPENDICPLCGQRNVSTLDHYLPQSTYPSLVITSANLVPSCAECNKTKSTFQASQQDEQVLHPYFDDIGNERWLFARVRQTSPAALIFYVDAPGTWDIVMRQRVATHFKKFDLGKLYASHSAVELNNIRHGLQKMARRCSPQEISENLRARAESCAAVHANSWQGVTYWALSESQWYCTGGFN